MKSIREILERFEINILTFQACGLTIDQAEKAIQEIINRKIKEALEEGKLMGKDLGGGK